MNPLGSEVFGTTAIKTIEYVLLAKVFVENGSTIESAALEIKAIDDMLAMQRMRCIINKHRFTPKGRLRLDAGLGDMCSTRFDKLMVELKNINQ